MEGATALRVTGSAEEGERGSVNFGADVVEVMVNHEGVK